MNFHIQGPQVLSATAQTLAATLAWFLVFVQAVIIPVTSSMFDSVPEAVI